MTTPIEPTERRSGKERRDKFKANYIEPSYFVRAEVMMGPFWDRRKGWKGGWALDSTTSHFAPPIEEK